jgi:hypothetical protein
MLIMGAIGLLTSSMAKKRGSGVAVDYDELADPDFIRSSGVAGRLSGQMGISEDEAIFGLQQTMGLMVAGGAPVPQPKKASAKKKSAATPKKSSSKATKTTPKKKSAKKKAGSDFQDLLDET